MTYQLTPEDKAANRMAKAYALLVDAMFMLEEIKLARALLPFATAQAQYVALGREIREFLKDEGVIS